MSKTVSITDAKANLSRLIRDLEKHGGEVIICRNGKPVAKLVALA